MYYLEDIQTYSKEESLENLRYAIGDIDHPQRTRHFLAIEHRGTLIGEIGYTVRLFTEYGNVAHMGYFILPEYWGNGYTTEAARAVLHYAFTEGGVIKMETGCNAANIASERIMIKCGLVREGHHKLTALCRGQLCDRLSYGLTRDEYFLQQQKVHGHHHT